MMWGYGFAWPMMLWMILGATLWIILLVILIWALVHWLNRRTMTLPPYETRHDTNIRPGGPSALEILQQRYARGEIDTTTYEQMRERLEASMTRDYQPTR